MASGKAPAFQFYAAEYLADENVQLLTLEQEGIYVRLLAYCWREGSIPVDPVKLSRLCKNAPAEALAGVVELFIPGSDGRLLHRRLEDQRQKHEEYRKAQAANGSRGGRPPKLKPDETQPKGLGLFRESQTKAKKRSSSAFASSSSTSSEDKGKELKTLALTALAVPAIDVFQTVTLNDGSEFPISEAKVSEWIPLYPGIDVRQQLRSYKAWAINNPTQRKTRSGIFKSINFWLGKAQNESRPMKGEINHGTHTAAVGPAIARQQRSDDAIDAAARFLSHQPIGLADETGQGELSGDGDFSRDGNNLARSVDGDSARLQPRPVHSRTEAMLQGKAVLAASR
jgi:uncharacterized protein YdaU (DUF1376 family)